MRKIEQEMLVAIEEGTDWCKGNTKVMFMPYNIAMQIYLYNNHIATYYIECNTVVPNHGTLAAYPTPTTTSRLRALGVNVTIKKGLPYIDGGLVT